MKSNRTIWFAVVAVALFIFAGAALVNCGGGAGDRNAVKVAMNMPVTGPFGIYGQTVRDGATMALNDLKTESPTVKISIDLQDNAGEPKTAGTVFEKQILNNPDIYVSGVKPQTMAIFDRVIQTGLPYFVWVFDAFITDENPTVFRTWVNYRYEPQKYIQYISSKKARRVAIAAVNFPHTVQEFNEIIIPRLKELGVDTHIEIYEWDTKGYKDLIVKLRDFKPDLYILNGFQENLAGLVKALRTYNLVGDGNVIGTYDLLDAANILTSAELDGLRVITPAFNIANNPEVEAWKERFQKTYDRQPLYTDAYAYDMILIIADAAKRLKLPATSKQWIDVLQATKIDGITGPLEFDKDRDLVPHLQIGVYHQGKLEIDQSEKQP